jgi:phosphoribosylformylglycinamidine synthase
MAKPRVIVLRAAGTNCDFETAGAFALAGAIAERVHVKRLVSGRVSLADYDILAVPGGFSYGDDIAAGKVFAVELHRRLGETLHQFVDQGKLVLGICNGFQVLMKTGLLPGAGFGEAGVAATLTWNTSGRFEDRWVRLAVPPGPCVFTRDLAELELPVAHAEGRFVTAGDGVLTKLRNQGQMAFRYTGAGGAEPVYPEDPNGSEDHVAGICDPTGRILGMMPHPERHVCRHQHPRWTRETGASDEGDGLALFHNAVEYVTD